MDIKNLFVELLKANLALEEDKSEWPQVSQLKSEDITRRKAFEADQADIDLKIEVLQSKVRALLAQMEANHREFWNHLRATYHLPRNGGYHITDDNRILISPVQEEGNGGDK